jgi:hypothetical protein
VKNLNKGDGCRVKIMELLFKAEDKIVEKESKIKNDLDMYNVKNRIIMIVRAISGFYHF